MEEKDVLQVNNYELQDISSYLRRTSVNSDSLHSESRQKFDPIVAKHLFEEGMKIINDKIQNLTDKLESTEKVIISNGDAMAALESKLNSEASQIEIPKGFDTNDTMTDKSFAALSLNKTDGRSVNDGNLNQIDETMAESVVNRNENLKDITKNSEQGVKDLDEYTKNNVGLNDITSNKEQEQQNLRFRNVVDQNSLRNINNGNESQVVESDSNSRIVKENISDMDSARKEIELEGSGDKHENES